MSTDLTGGFILVCFAIFAVFWLVAAFQTKRTIESAGRPQWFWLLLTAVALTVVPRLGGAHSISSIVLWPQTLAVGLIADVITCLGLVIALWARVVLGGNWSSNVAFKEQHELIERGPYAYVRHPIYSGVLLMFLGIAIFRGSVTGFVLLAILFVGLWLKAGQEEKLLTRHFGEAYPQYKKRVKALVPFVL